MSNPVICIRDASVANSVFQITDFWPSRSQANPVVDPAPQGPRYLRQPENTLPVVTALAVAREVSGLAAYLLVTVDADGANFTGAQAKAAADAIITAMRAGDALAEADINDILDGVVAGAGIVGTGNSTATVGNILAILGGAKFVVPVGTDVDDAYLTEAQQEALFDSDVYSPINDQDSSFWLSLARGQLRKAISSRVSRTGAVLDPLVVVYLADGTIAE